MLRRTALILLALFLTAAAGLFAADRMGVNLPWSVATTDSDGTVEREATEKAAADVEQASKEAEAAIEEAPDAAIDDTIAALTPGDDASAPGSVALDISRVSPSGPSVFAGRTDPDAYVTVFEDGKPAGTVQADASGSWSLSTEHKFASADPNITFKATATPPPKAEPEAPARTAAATDTAQPAPAEPADDTSAPAVAGDVMRKFEKLVSEAREDAAREKAAQEETAKEDAKDEEDRQPERAAPDVAEREVEPETEPNRTADRETTVAAANDNEPAKPAPSASSQPEREEAKAQDNEADEPASDAKASGEADSAPSSKTTVGGEAAEKSSETDTAMMAAPGKSAKPEAQAPIPVPIMFVYNEPTLTSEGERAADLLLEYLLLKRLDSVELTGHADERGTLAYNFDLSRERLETVAEILKEGGYKGELKLTPKGKTEPFTGIDRSKYNGEALYQFDRRVELRIKR